MDCYKSDIEFKICEEPEESFKYLLRDYKYIKSNKKIEYLNVPIAFDIESSSFYNEDGEKCACMYAYTFNINGRHILGRCWNEFLSNYNDLINYYHPDKDHRVLIFVHNLSFEFQWFSKLFEWEKVFALSKREVVYALTKDGVEFRCSYVLSGYSLAKLGDELTLYPVKKMVGDLDYKKIRLPRYNEFEGTYLTDEEKRYIYHDGLVVVSYIMQCIINERNNITNIPLTKTGYVRRYCRNACLYNGDHRKNSSKYLKYRSIIKPLIINSINEYMEIKRAFIGAHTHANPLSVGLVVKDVYSMDFTSSYPYQMISSDNFPMSRGIKVKIQSKAQFYDLIEKYCCIFDITFYNIESITPFEHFIPSSKCYVKENAVYDNGKIVSASKISMTMNEVDFKTYSKFYKWESIGIKNFRRYMKGYLPKNFILAILHLYNDKTKLKGIKEKYAEYMHSKSNLNSAYG